jgi:glycosyltransferase involved in cell wall biosynthesis
MKPIPVLLVTHNRLAYSVYALASILDAGVPVEVTIWDNASTDGTAVWLKYLKHPKIKRVCLSEDNMPLASVMNGFFRTYKDATFVCKVDNDTVLPKGWLKDIHALMKEMVNGPDRRVGAISAHCLRPGGMTAKDWYKSMEEVNRGGVSLRKNGYICGTGVLINMDMIRQRGLLFEGEPCVMGGWTSYCRIGSEYENWNFYFHMGVFARLLNLESDHTLSNDYPEYDEEMASVRDEGNQWWEKIKGVDGIRQLIEKSGGLEEL